MQEPYKSASQIRQIMQTVTLGPWMMYDLNRINLEDNSSSAHLVKVKFNIYQWHPLAHLIVMPDDPVDSFGNILEHQIKIELILFSC